ncbi:hypothetical protein M413DRAFT_239595 [Hebeloma cylindrosporum]|uniref:Uncharacterized protein n=1 Tax=Hebeloma cylindrosporum TaxID=76867 RepID=A0A0C2YCB4_HEBCY|nr:hypothetical protein M413DRAFT_239595 [Hebeloma cylindrosporum h7]
MSYRPIIKQKILAPAKIPPKRRGNPGLEQIENVVGDDTKESLVDSLKCLVNDFPSEILASIFSIGVEERDDLDEDEDHGWEDIDMESDSNDDDAKDDSDSDNEPAISIQALPFQVLVSHVCRRWREVALDSHILWTTLTFARRPRLEWARMYVTRSGVLPLNISIYCTFEKDNPAHPLYEKTKGFPERSIDDAEKGESHSEANDMDDGGEDDQGNDNVAFISQRELGQILDLVEPEVSRWAVFEFHGNHAGYTFLMSRLHALPDAPRLETFRVYYFGHEDDKAGFLPFHGDAPRLKEVILWNVPINWDATLTSFLRGLEVFQLYHQPEGTHPSYKTFAQIINNSPDLHTFSLSRCGPVLSADVPYDTDIESGGWGTTPLTILSLKNMLLELHDPRYATALIKHLDVPNVTSLVIDYGGEDYSEFVDALSKPVNGRTESILQHIKHMAIGGLPCSVNSAEALLGQLTNLKSLNLKTKAKLEEKIMFQKLADPYAGRPPVIGDDCNPEILPVLFCPSLECLVTNGASGEEVKQLLRVRKKLGVPLKWVTMNQEDPLTAKEERWIRENVEELNFFVPDSEKDFETDDEDGESGVEGDSGDNDG